MKNLHSNLPVDELLRFAKEKQPEIYKYAEDQLIKKLEQIGKNYENEKDKALTKALLKSIIVNSWAWFKNGKKSHFLPLL